MLAFAVQAQSPEESDSLATQSWYRDYASNPYVLEVPFTEDSLNGMSQRKSRYRFRLIYLSRAELQRADSQLKIGFFSDAENAGVFSTVARLDETSVAARKVNENEFSGVIAKLSDRKSDHYLVLSITNRQVDCTRC